MTAPIKVGDSVWYCAETTFFHYRGGVLEREDVRHHRVYGTVAKITPNDLWGDIATLSVGTAIHEAPIWMLHLETL